VVLLATDHGSSTDTSTGASRPAARRLAVTPLVGPHEGGLRLKLVF
jgi:hypothetical protein